MSENASAPSFPRSSSFPSGERNVTVTLDSPEDKEWRGGGGRGGERESFFERESRFRVEMLCAARRAPCHDKDNDLRLALSPRANQGQ